jgi:hypothetical protein
LISVDELRAAGALDVPASWQKSLGVERKQFPLFGDDDMSCDEQMPTPRESAANDEAEDDESGDEL